MKQTTALNRLRKLERKIDEAERTVVFALLSPIKRRRYWQSTREIRRGSIGEP